MITVCRYISKQSLFLAHFQLVFILSSGALNDQLEDVWGDDLDADVMDDIMLAATQLTQNV